MHVVPKYGCSQNTNMKNVLQKVLLTVLGTLVQGV